MLTCGLDRSNFAFAMMPCLDILFGAGYEEERFRRRAHYVRAVGVIGL
jgi:hypothetical protein